MGNENSDASLPCHNSFKPENKNESNVVNKINSEKESNKFLSQSEIMYAINGFIRTFENKYQSELQIPTEIIPIIVYYFEKINKMPKCFEITEIMTINDFEIQAIVGQGQFGETVHVWKVQLKSTNEMYALTILKKKHLKSQKYDNNKTLTERSIISNISHPFVVSLRYAFETKSKLFIVMDLFTGTKLCSHGTFTEKQTKFYCAEIFLAIECLHSYNIIYGHLQPENIILDNDGHVRITDFNVKPINCNGKAYLIHTFCSTHTEYLPPEIIMIPKPKCACNKPVDWWGFGTILYEMLCGSTPFYDTNEHKMYHKILYGKIPFHKFMSRASIELVVKLLTKSPNKRILCRDIKKSLFFQSIDWYKLYNKEIIPPIHPLNSLSVLNTNQSINSEENEPKSPNYSFKCHIPKSNFILMGD